jgi:hypothetical protein
MPVDFPGPKNNLEQRIRITRRRMRLLHLIQVGNKLAEFHGVVAAVGGERHLDEHDKLETQRRGRKFRTIAADDARHLQRRSAA